MMIFSLVAMIGLEKCCITSACLQWLCHSGERIVARGPLVLFCFVFFCFGLIKYFFLVYMNTVEKKMAEHWVIYFVYQIQTVLDMGIVYRGNTSDFLK